MTEETDTTVVCHRNHGAFVVGGTYAMPAAAARRLVAEAPDAFTVLPHALGRRDRMVHAVRTPEGEE